MDVSGHMALSHHFLTEMVMTSHFHMVYKLDTVKIPPGLYLDDTTFTNDDLCEFHLGHPDRDLSRHPLVNDLVYQLRMRGTTQSTHLLRFVDQPIVKQ
jgi:hypothetical protein